jgi:hypothetical protein
MLILPIQADSGREAGSYIWFAPMQSAFDTLSYRIVRCRCTNDGQHFKITHNNTDPNSRCAMDAIIIPE